MSFLINPFATAAAVSSPAVLLIHGDGADDSTSFTDSSPNNFSLTAYDGAKVATEQSVFGGACMDFTHGSNDARIVTPTSAALAMDGDFCLKFRVRFTSVSGGIYFLVADGGTLDLYLYTTSTGKIGGYILGSVRSDLATVAIDTWYAVCIDRLGNTTKIFLDGTQIDSVTTTVGMGTTATWYFGANPAFGGSGSGGRVFMDEIALWSESKHQADYTVETAAFT